MFSGHKIVAHRIMYEVSMFWLRHLVIQTLTFFRVTDALLHCRFVVVAKLNICRVPSSAVKNTCRNLMPLMAEVAKTWIKQRTFWQVHYFEVVNFFFEEQRTFWGKHKQRRLFWCGRMWPYRGLNFQYNKPVLFQGLMTKKVTSDLELGWIGPLWNFARKCRSYSF